VVPGAGFEPATSGHQALKAPFFVLQIMSLAPWPG